MFVLSPLQQFWFFVQVLHLSCLSSLLSVTEVLKKDMDIDIEHVSRTKTVPLLYQISYDILHTYIIYCYIYIYFSIQIPVSILHLAVSHPNIHLFLASWNTTIFFHLAHHISQGRMSPWSDVGDRRSRCSLGLCPVKVDMNVCWSTRHPVITMSDLSETSHTCWILLVRFWNRGVKVDRYH